MRLRRRQSPIDSYGIFQSITSVIYNWRVRSNWRAILDRRCVVWLPQGEGRLETVSPSGGACCVAFLYCSSLVAADIGQWDFDSGDLSATAGATLGPLQYSDGPSGATRTATQFGTTASFGIPSIGGGSANVMKFPAATS